MAKHYVLRSILEYQVSCILKKINGIDQAKFLLILCVVLIHCDYLPQLQNTDAPYSPTPATRDTILFISHSLIGGCVMAFFTISGFLFYRNMTPDNPVILRNKFVSKLKSRVWTLFIPYLIWNLIASVLFILKYLYLGKSGYDVFTENGFSIFNFIKGFWDLNSGYPYDFALWFVRNLIVISLFTPLLFFIIKNRVLVALLICYTLLTEDYLFGTAYFVIGGCVGCYDPNLRCMNNQWIGPISTVLFLGAAILLNNGFEEPVLFSVFTLIRNLAMTVSFIYLGRFIPENKRFVNLLFSSTFFIYAFHALYCGIPRDILIAKLGLGNTFDGLTVFFTSFIFMTASTFLTYSLMRKFFPRLTNLLNGQR